MSIYAHRRPFDLEEYLIFLLLLVFAAGAQKWGLAGMNVGSTQSCHSCSGKQVADEGLAEQ